jgi:hypothetical protein
MRQILITFATLVVLMPGMITHAQDVQTNLDAALTSYKSGDLDQTRYSLQQALSGINQAIGKEILLILPASMEGMVSSDDGDNLTGTSFGFAGLFVSRSYSGENTSASIEIISDSPMLSGINALLTMPAFMSSDPNQKRIKVNNYKALLTRSDSDEGIVSYTMQLPFSNSLLTFNCSGFDSEEKVTGMAGLIPVDQIVKLTQ